MSSNSLYSKRKGKNSEDGATTATTTTTTATNTTEDSIHDANKRLLLERSCKVLSHEIGHMMGIAHCTYYECLLNGSGHLEEDFRQPLHLCPVDLRKVSYCCRPVLITVCVTLGVEVEDRYRALIKFYEKVEFDEEKKWVEDRLQWIEQVEKTRTTILVEDSE